MAKKINFDNPLFEAGEPTEKRTGRPKRGDIIFFSNYSDKSYYQGYRHVGIVTGSDSKYVYTVEGNTVTYNKYTSKVAKKSYELSSTKIAAYGIIK